MHAVFVSRFLFAVPELDFFAGILVEGVFILQDVFRHLQGFGDKFLVMNPVKPAEHPTAALLVAFEVARSASL